MPRQPWEVKRAWAFIMRIVGGEDWREDVVDWEEEDAVLAER